LEEVWGVAAIFVRESLEECICFPGPQTLRNLLQRCHEVVLVHGWPDECLRLLVNVAVAIPRILCLDATDAARHDPATVVEVEFSAGQCRVPILRQHVLGCRGIGIFPPNEAAFISGLASSAKPP
jgi:hypothetical protein